VNATEGIRGRASCQLAIGLYRPCRQYARTHVTEEATVTEGECIHHLLFCLLDYTAELTRGSHWHFTVIYVASKSMLLVPLWGKSSLTSSYNIGDKSRRHIWAYKAVRRKFERTPEVFLKMMLLDRPWSPPKLGAKLYFQQHHNLRSNKMAEQLNFSKVLRTHNPCYARWYQHSDWRWYAQNSICFDMKREAMRVYPFFVLFRRKKCVVSKGFPHICCPSQETRHRYFVSVKDIT
jgi:hypothetical protein